MRDYLLDIVSHTQALGCIDVIKVTGDEQTTTLDSVSDDRSVIIKATFKNVNNDFKGTFGLPNLNKLNTILNIPEYKDNAKIELVTRESNGQTLPESINFINQTGDFRNNYRFMSEITVQEKIKEARFKGVKWDVEFEPTDAALLRFKFQASANSEETHFVAKTENNDLKFYFGDPNSHAGNFVFYQNITGTLPTSNWNWPIMRFMSILNLNGDKKVKFSNEGAAEITVDSGLIEYRYIIPAATK
jgi:hypothetical protein